jgi:hypothetical protein
MTFAKRAAILKIMYSPVWIVAPTARKNHRAKNAGYIVTGMITGIE